MITKTYKDGIAYFNDMPMSVLQSNSVVSIGTLYTRLNSYFDNSKFSPYDTLEELLKTPLHKSKKLMSKKGGSIKRIKRIKRENSALYDYEFEGRIVSAQELSDMDFCVVNVDTLRRRITSTLANGTPSSLRHLMELPLLTKRKCEIENLPFELLPDEKLLNTCMHVNPGYKTRIC